ncbi:hypothetical protein HK097_009551, partial [Rhizophlyctis rosea]
YTGALTVTSQQFSVPTLSSNNNKPSTTQFLIHTTRLSFRGKIGYYIDAPTLPRVRVSSPATNSTGTVIETPSVELQSLNEKDGEKGPWWVVVDARKKGEDVLDDVEVELGWDL